MALNHAVSTRQCIAGVEIGVNSEHRVLTPYVGATLIFYTDWWRYTAPQHQSLVLIQLSPVAGVNLFSVRENLERDKLLFIGGRSREATAMFHS